MPQSARLLIPRPALARCVFAAIYRDTRGLSLPDAQRFNHFPASPLVGVSVVFHGETRLVPMGATLDTARFAAPAARVMIAGPSSAPLSSWNPGAVQAISIGVFPDAWQRLTGTNAACLQDRISNDIPASIMGALGPASAPQDIEDFWQGFQDRLEIKWIKAGGAQDASAFPRLADWTQHLLSQAAMSGPGRSLRSIERRVRRRVGQSPQALASFAAIDRLHGLAVQGADQPLARLALDAGFSDQSHMGRMVKRTTGFSPARLNRMIQTNEAFWCYRLLGERF